MKIRTIALAVAFAFAPAVIANADTIPVKPVTKPTTGTPTVKPVKTTNPHHSKPAKGVHPTKKTKTTSST